MRLLLFADGDVGSAVAEWLLENHRDDLELVVSLGDSHVVRRAKQFGISCTRFESSDQFLRQVRDAALTFDLGVLAWWPKILNGALVDLPANGWVNTHPSLLPYNRGKHYNFWALVEQSPFGVTLHKVDRGIDTGDLLFQKAIRTDWTDTGETLYRKAARAMIELFKEAYPSIRRLDFSPRAQELAMGSFHRGSEMDAASRIDLERSYRARDLLNLIRARTFSGHPACTFTEDGETFEVRIQIERKKT